MLSSMLLDEELHRQPASAAGTASSQVSNRPRHLLERHTLLARTTQRGLKYSTYRQYESMRYIIDEPAT